MRDALETLKNGSPTTKASDAADILASARGNGERYAIDMGAGRENDKMVQAGKINLIEATIDGKPIGQPEYGAVDYMGVKSTKDYHVGRVSAQVNQEKGFVFATDGNCVQYTGQQRGAHQSLCAQSFVPFNGWCKVVAKPWMARSE